VICRRLTKSGPTIIDPPRRSGVQAPGDLGHGAARAARGGMWVWRVTRTGKLVGRVHPDVWEIAGHVFAQPRAVSAPLTRAFLLTKRRRVWPESAGVTLKEFRPQGVWRAVGRPVGRMISCGARSGLVMRRLLATAVRWCSPSAVAWAALRLALTDDGRVCWRTQQDIDLRHDRHGQCGDALNVAWTIDPLAPVALPVNPISTRRRRSLGPLGASTTESGGRDDLRRGRDGSPSRAGRGVCPPAGSASAECRRTAAARSGWGSN